MNTWQYTTQKAANEAGRIKAQKRANRTGKAHYVLVIEQSERNTLGNIETFYTQASLSFVPTELWHHVVEVIQPN